MELRQFLEPEKIK